MNQVLLSDVCEINPRMDPGISDDSECSFVPMEYVDDISGTITNTSIRRVSDVKKGYTFFKNDDVIFAKITPCMENGKCAIGKNLKNGIAFGSTEYHVVRAKEEIIPDWIYHFLRQEKVRQQATHWFRGTAGQQRVPATFLEELKIPLPPLTEQKRIASLLRRADRLRQLRRTAHDLGDALLQSVFLEMFGEALNGKNPEIPLVPLETLCTKITDGTHVTPNYIESGVPFISIKDLTRTPGTIDFSVTRFISRDEHEKISKLSNVERDDILYTKVGSYGIAQIVDTDRKFSIFVSVALLKPDKSKILPKFFEIVMNSVFVREQADRLVSGIGVPDLHLREIKTFQIPLPPLSLQEEFAGVVARIESLRGRMGESTRQVEGLFESLLSEAFNA